MIMQKTIKGFLEELSSDSPTPGGGSADALVASIGVSLAMMAAKISSNRKAFKQITAKEQKEFKVNLNKLEKLKTQIDLLIEEDVSCFDTYMQAYKSKNVSNLKKATKKCFDCPYKLATLIIEALKTVSLIDKYVVSSVASDLEMSYTILKASLKSCKSNMKINLTKYIDKGSKEKYKTICPKINKLSK